MVAETLAFSDAFDSLFTIRRDIDRAIERRIPILMMTESQALFDARTRANIQHKKLLIDIAAAKQAYNDK